MALFKRKTGGVAKPATKTKSSSGIAAQPVNLIQGPDESYALAFGLRWRTLLKSGGREVSISLARAAKGTHYVHLSQQVGYGVFPKNQTGDLYPAALMAAKINASVALFCLEIGQNQYWVCLVRNGLPTTADDILEGEESDAVQRMRHVLAQFADEQITVYSDIRQTGIAGLQEFSLHDLFDVARAKVDLVQVLPKGGPRIPLPIMLAAIGGAVILLGQKFYTEYKHNERMRELALLNTPEVDPEVAWAPVLRKFLTDNAKADRASLARVRSSLGELPVMWSGWWLTGARCQAGENLVQGNKTWGCTANYKRTPVGQVASAMESTVKKLMPAAAVSFPTIASMSVNWSLSVPAAALVIDELPTPDAQTLLMLSSMQPLLPTLAMSPDFKMVPVNLPAPKMKDGKAYPRPPSVPDFYSGQVLIKGPMRSIDFASTRLPPVDWRAIGVQFDEKASPSAKGLTASSLMAEIDGRVLAKKGTTQ